MIATIIATVAAYMGDEEGVVSPIPRRKDDIWLVSRFEAGSEIKRLVQRLASSFCSE
jgi:hypothetical protein